MCQALQNTEVGFIIFYIMFLLILVLVPIIGISILSGDLGISDYPIAFGGTIIVAQRNFSTTRVLKADPITTTAATTIVATVVVPNIAITIIIGIASFFYLLFFLHRLLLILTSIFQQV